MLKFLLGDAKGNDVAVNNDDGEDRGLVVATRDHKTYDTKTVFFTNDTYGREMAQNAAFGPGWVLHDGTDNTQMDSGQCDGNTEDHVIDSGNNFSADGTAAVGVTLRNVDDSTYANITAVADGDLTFGSDICPDGNEVFIVGPTWTFSEEVGTKWVEDDTGQAHANSKSLKCDNPAVNDIMQLTNIGGTNLSTANFTALTMWIYVDKDWEAGDSFSVYGYNDGGAAQVGDKVFLEDYFDYDNYDTWHYINIPLSDMGLASETIDAFQFQNEARDGGKSPEFWIDEITLQSSGASIDFSVEPDKGTWFHIKAFQTTFVDVHDPDSENSTMPNLAYDKILSMATTNGYIYKRYCSGDSNPVSEARITNIMDLLAYPYSEITNHISDGTNTLITISNTYPAGMAFVLRAEDLDKIVYTIEDDFSALYYFRISVQGYTEKR